MVLRRGAGAFCLAFATFQACLGTPVEPEADAPMRVKLQEAYAVEGIVRTVSATNDGVYIALAIREGFQVHDLRKKRLLRKIDGTGSRVAFVGKDRDLLIGKYDVRGVTRVGFDGTMPRKLDMPGHFFGYGQDTPIATGDDSALSTHDPATGKVLHSWKGKGDYHRISIRGVSPCGRVLANCNGKDRLDLVVWRPGTKTAFIHSTEKPCTSIAVSPGPDGVVVFGYLDSPAVEVYSEKTGKLLRKLEHEGKGHMTGVAFSPDGRYLFTLFGINDEGKPEVAVWHAKGGFKKLGTFVVGEGRMQGLYAMPDSSGFVTFGGSEHRTTVWKVVPVRK